MRRVLFPVLALCALFSIAHAADAAAAAPAGLDWQVWLAVSLGALAGLRVVVDGLLGFFKLLAPKTKTTADDTIRDDLQLAHDKLDSLAVLVGQLIPNSKPQQTGGAS